MYATIWSERDRRYVIGAAKWDTESLNVTSSTVIGFGFVIQPRSEHVGTAIRPIYVTKPQTVVGRGKAMSRSCNIGWKNIRCSHCRKFHHNKEKCFPLIGFPEGWRIQRKDNSIGNVVAIVTEIREEEKEVSGTKAASRLLGFSHAAVAARMKHPGVTVERGEGIGLGENYLPTPKHINIYGLFH